MFKGSYLIILCRILTVLSFFLVSPADADDAKSIMLFTWRGMTQAEEGFTSKLKDLGVEATYHHFDAERNVDRLAGYLREHREELARMDLIYTFGTTTTMTVQNFDLGKVPQVFNIVTDPVGTGITKSLQTPTKGATGAMVSLSAMSILELLEKAYPFKSVAILFDPREANAVQEADTVALAAAAMGKKAFPLRLIPDNRDVESLVAALIPKISLVDAVYVASTSSFMAHAGLLRRVIPEDKVSVTSSPALLTRGVTMAVGDEYRKRGEAAAALAAEILLNGKRPDQVPINEVGPDEAVVFIREGSSAGTKLNLDKLSNTVKYR